MSNLCRTKSHLYSARKDDLVGQFPRLREEWEGLKIERLKMVVKAKNAFRAQLRQTQDFPCLLGGRHFSSELFCNPDDTFDEFCVILGKNTL